MVLHYLRRVVPNATTTSQIEKVYENGVEVDANTKEPLVKGHIDRGHKAGYEDTVMRKCAEKCHMTQRDYTKMMQNPRLYQYETSKNNRSHLYESKDRLFQIHHCIEVIRNYQNRNRNRVGGRYKATPFTFRQDYLSNNNDSRHPADNQMNNKQNIIQKKQKESTNLTVAATIF